MLFSEGAIEYNVRMYLYFDFDFPIYISLSTLCDYHHILAISPLHHVRQDGR